MAMHCEWHRWKVLNGYTVKQRVTTPGDNSCILMESQEHWPLEDNVEEEKKLEGIFNSGVSASVHYLHAVIDRSDLCLLS